MFHCSPFLASRTFELFGEWRKGNSISCISEWITFQEHHEMFEEHEQFKGHHDKRVSWKGGVMTRGHHDRGASWQGGVMTRGHHDRGASWQGGVMTRGASWQGGVMTRGRHDKGASWQGGIMTRCVVTRGCRDKGMSWQGGVMTRGCPDQSPLYLFFGRESEGSHIKIQDTFFSCLIFKVPESEIDKLHVRDNVKAAEVQYVTISYLVLTIPLCNRW